jgi:Tfp pilus assembly protein PilV
MFHPDRRNYLFLRRAPAERGFSLVEALIGAALISITALGLGTTIHHLMQSRQKSQSVSLAVQTESSLVNAIQDPSSYASIADILKSGGTPPNSFTLNVAVDAEKSFSIHPTQQLYLDNNLQTCNGFDDKNCTMMVALSGWGKNIPIPGQYSFAYSIESNPNIGNMPALGSASANFSTSDYILTVPSMTNTGKTVQCGVNAVGLLGVDAAGDGICLYYSGNSATCKTDEIPKGFQVIADPGDTHRYYLSFQCVPIRKISCANSDYSFENFNPSSLDPTTPAGPAVGKCVYIGAPSSGVISASGTNGLQVYQLCAPNYADVSPSCAISGPVTGVNVTCSDGHVLTANTSGVTTQISNTGSAITCQAVLPQQTCCSDDPSKCTQVNVPLKVNYTCQLDSSHQDQLVY